MFKQARCPGSKIERVDPVELY